MNVYRYKGITLEGGKYPLPQGAMDKRAREIFHEFVKMPKLEQETYRVREKK